MCRNRLRCIAAIFALLAQVAYAQLRIPGLEPPPPFCKRGTDSTAGNWEVVDTLTLSPTQKRVPQIRLVTAGAALAIRLDPRWKSGSPDIRVSVYVKQFGTWPFEVVCRNVLLRPRVGGLGLEARRPGQEDGSVWRIEVTGAGDQEMSMSSGTLTIWRPPRRRSEVNDAPVTESLSEAAGLLCINEEEPPAGRRNTAGFGGKTRLDIELADSDLPLTQEQRAMITRTLLTAASLWVQACIACRVEQLSVITVGTDTFVRSGLNAWYQRNFGESRPLDTPRDLSAPDKELREALEPVQWLLAGEQEQPAPRSKQFTAYERVPVGPSGLLPLCRLPVTQDQAPTVATIQAAVCEGQRTNSPSRTRMQIRFSRGHTACGDDPNIIGCRADNELTEYNVRDYQFGFDAADRDTQPIGLGPIRVGLLHAIVHEMGHWIGLPHLKGSETIMASSLQVSRCIDSHTIASLVAELGRKQRQETAASKPAAFTYRLIPTSTQHRRRNRDR